ncbi:TadE/TadG family type IV pilus assembly protein [Acetobacter fallax]|uniref:Flp pilus-assembly TadG-like N-terminal domain-containing protein n=1 Tax=Acetobacter fallax TaxID=1737473 RepID=A0ABX0KBI6_9PROT|nr:hypothetical protein [Acetobacter fallax]NHO32218.1 hypothetical protein [Acetobacter fallax]NHO35729.1 hypothetical protein [Acetobacter fallax]
MMRPLPFWRDRRGGVAFLTALWAVPALIGVAAAVNYGLCIESRSRLNAMADAATLAVVSTGKISEPAAQAGSDAETLFRSAAATLPGVTITSVDVSVSSTDSSTTTVKRVATLRYSAAFPLLMGGFLGMPSLSLTGMSEATGSTPANIDFYLLVDTSPSMAFPATSTGMDAMLAATKSQSSGNGCAFACHQTTTSATNPGGTPLDSASGKYLDNYQIAINQGISLRIDVIRSAITDLIQTVSASGGKNAATYRMAISTFDYSYSPVSAVTGDTDTLTQAAQQIELLAVCSNNARVCGVSNSDMDTNFTAAFAGESDSLPAMSGTGTNNSGDTPQVVLFLLTDGMRDENVSGGRALGAIPVALCEDLKQNRNIRIAVLYTQYLVDDLQTNAWSVSHVMSFLSPTDTLEENLQSCASPGLFYEVTTNDDVSTALQTLFQRTLATAHLTQ